MLFEGEQTATNVKCNLWHNWWWFVRRERNVWMRFQGELCFKFARFMTDLTFIVLNVSVLTFHREDCKGMLVFTITSPVTFQPCLELVSCRFYGWRGCRWHLVKSELQQSCLWVVSDQTLRHVNEAIDLSIISFSHDLLLKKNAVWSSGSSRNASCPLATTLVLWSRFYNCYNS